MPNSSSDNQAHGRLSAFADADLDADQSLAVLAQMAHDPRAARVVMHQQQLRQGVARTMKAQAPAMPAELRARIENSLPVPAPEVPAPAALRFQSMWRWFPLAAAAVLLVTALTLFYNTPRHTFVAPSAVVTQVLAPEYVDLFSSRHVLCTRQLNELLKTHQFPEGLEEMPAAIADFLHRQPYPALDLSQLGYRFWKAGECVIPGKVMVGSDSVHLIYTRGGQQPRDRSDAISLWIAIDTGGLDSKIAADKPYTASEGGRDGGHPLIVWRHAGLIYYLVGDSMDSAEGAVKLLTSRG